MSERDKLRDEWQTVLDGEFVPVGRALLKLIARTFLHLLGE